MNATRAKYFDYAATTPVDSRVVRAMREMLGEDGDFGNAGSVNHEFGTRAGARIDTARTQVAVAVGAKAGEIIWTSGATEANNLALFGVARYYAGRGRHIVTSRIEHKAVLDPCKQLEKLGWQVTYLSPNRDGLIAPDQVGRAAQSDTVLVSIAHVHNEIGAVQDIAGIAAVCRPRGIWLHVDAAQSVGKLPFDVAAMGADLVSLSAHKAYGPKGIGALVIADRAGVHLEPLLWGGGQERGLRSGTLPTHQIAGMGLAFELAMQAHNEDHARAVQLNARLLRGLAGLGGVLRNGNAKNCVPQILSLSFEGVEGESLLAAVGPYIAASAGSTCTSATQEPSYVLRALGRDDQLAASTLRLSLGRSTTEGEVDIAVGVISAAVQRLRRIAAL
jgi:cysteine desulfurase